MASISERVRKGQRPTTATACGEAAWAGVRLPERPRAMPVHEASQAVVSRMRAAVFMAVRGLGVRRFLGRCRHSGNAPVFPACRK